jgi:hypothetical protein
LTYAFGNNSMSSMAVDDYEKLPPEEKEQDANSRMELSSTLAQDVYEIRPRNDRDGFDLISDRLRRGPIWYAGPDANCGTVLTPSFKSMETSTSSSRAANESRDPLLLTNPAREENES